MERVGFPVELAIALLVLGGIVYIGKQVVTVETTQPVVPAVVVPGK